MRVSCLSVKLPPTLTGMLCSTVELGVVIGKGGRDISRADAMKHVAGYTLAIDYTGRNMQNQVKKKGLPWSAAKGMDTWWSVPSVSATPRLRADLVCDLLAPSVASLKPKKSRILTTCFSGTRCASFFVERVPGELFPFGRTC